MGCQQTKCLSCGGSYKACQLINGLCASCKSKIENQNNTPSSKDA